MMKKKEAIGIVFACVIGLGIGWFADTLLVKVIDLRIEEKLLNKKGNYAEQHCNECPRCPSDK